MSAWMIAAAALLLGFVPCGLLARRGSVLDAVVALEMAGVLTMLTLLLLAASFDRPPFYDLALVLAALSFAGALVFVRFLERWI